MEIVDDIISKNVDKILHFTVSFFLCVLIASPGINPILPVFLIGFAKEVIDKLRGGNFSFPDLLADSVGILVATIIQIV